MIILLYHPVGKPKLTAFLYTTDSSKFIKQLFNPFNCPPCYFDLYRIVRRLKTYHNKFCLVAGLQLTLGGQVLWKQQKRFPLMGISSFFKQLCKPKHNIDITVLSTNTGSLWRNCKPRLSNKSKSVLIWRCSNKEFSFLNEWRSSLLERRASLVPNLIPMRKFKKAVILAHMH